MCERPPGQPCQYQCASYEAIIYRLFKMISKALFGYWLSMITLDLSNDLLTSTFLKYYNLRPCCHLDSFGWCDTRPRVLTLPRRLRSTNPHSGHHPLLRAFPL